MSRRFAFLLLALLVGALAILLWLVPVEPHRAPLEEEAAAVAESAPEEAPPSVEPPAAAEAPSGPPVVVYFEGGDTFLHVERRPAAAQPDALDRVEVAIGELLRGPEDPSLVRNLPEGATLRALFFGPPGYVTVDLDLPREKLAAFGSHTEWMALQSLVGTVLAAAPNDVRGVFVTVGGSTPDTFAGHVRLDEPLHFDATLLGDGVPWPGAARHQDDHEPVELSPPQAADSLAARA